MSDTSIAAPPISTVATTTSSRLDGQLSRDGRFRWSGPWQRWVPTGKEIQQELPAPLESGPLLPERHSASCVCDNCLNAGQRYSDYLKAKADPWR